MLNIAILGITAKKMVELTGAPSYTSGDHMCKGAAAILKKNAAEIKTKPIIIDDSKFISTSFEPANNKERFSKLVVPTVP